MILDCSANGLLSGKCRYEWKNTQSIPLTDELFAADSYCMAGLRTQTVGIYEKDTGRSIVRNVAGYPYTFALERQRIPVRFVCIEPGSSAGCSGRSQEWSSGLRCRIGPRPELSTTLSTRFER